MAPRRSRNRIALLVCVGLAVTAPALGVLVTLVQLQRAFGGVEAVDASDKARYLANGISEAMNGAAGGGVVCLLAVVGVVVFTVRLRREAAAAAASPSEER